MDKQKFEVGQEVALFRPGGFHKTLIEIATVEKVTPSGYVVAGGRRFKPNGVEQGKKYLAWCIDSDVAHFRAVKERQEQANKIVGHVANILGHKLERQNEYDADTVLAYCAAIQAELDALRGLVK